MGQTFELCNHVFNPIGPGRGVGGGEKVPALTLNVNNFSNIEANVGQT